MLISLDYNYCRLCPTAWLADYNVECLQALSPQDKQATGRLLLLPNCLTIIAVYITLHSVLHLSI